MPTPLVVPNTVQITVRGTDALRPWANVFHVHTSGDLGPNGQALAVLDAYVSELLPHLCHDVEVTDAAYVDLSSSTGGTGVVPPTDTDHLQGGVMAPQCPVNVTYLFRYGGISERHVRNGRSYIPGVREDDVDGRGRIDEGWLPTVQAAATSFVSTVLANALAPLVTVHNPAGGSPSTSEILGVLVSDLVATQRRRLRS